MQYISQTLIIPFENCYFCSTTDLLFHVVVKMSQLKKAKRPRFFSNFKYFLIHTHTEYKIPVSHILMSIISLQMKQKTPTI